MNAHYKNLVNSNNDNRLAIFVGSGISAGCNLPLWSDLIKVMLADLNTDETDYLKIAQLYYLEFGDDVYSQLLRKYIPNNISPSIVHEMIFELEPQHIITTNWDNLLEKEIENKALIFDVVSSDKDLVKSTYNKKLIKMHGDINSHNIVFKEDDYLKYKHNFPLIENYVKAILSTHTILFLGYSYSDYNLKQIIKWLQVKSSSLPSRYLVTFKDEPSQKLYLENHGIKTLVIKGEENDKNQTLFDFLKHISSLDNLVKVVTDEDVIEYVYLKLISLDELDSILFDQIKLALPNCKIIYSEVENINLLFLPDNIKDIRNINSRFRSIVNECFKKNKDQKFKLLPKIFNILYKADLYGIVTSSELESGTYEDIRINQVHVSELKDNLINFNYIENHEKNGSEINKLRLGSIQEYNLGNFTDALGQVDKLISIYRMDRNYTRLFIELFNRNLIIKFMQLENVDVNQNKSKIYNLRGLFLNLPKNIQINLESILDFIDFNYIYRKIHVASEKLRGIHRHKKIIENGGYAFNNNLEKFSESHTNIINFVLSNRIMIDEYTEFRGLIKYFVEISIESQLLEKIVILNKTELFSMIKYLKNDEIFSLISVFLIADSEQRKSINISNNNIKWLIEKVLVNLSKLVDVTNIDNDYEKQFINTLSLLSLTKLNKEQLEQIICIVKNIISESKAGLVTYNVFNKFLATQLNLFENVIDGNELISIIELIISKFVYKNINGFESHLFNTIYLNNLFITADIANIKFSNESLIQKFLVELNEVNDSNQKIDFIQGLLLNLYKISDETVKFCIEEFLSNISIDYSNVAQEKEIIYELLLVLNSFRDTENSLLEPISQFIETFKDGKSFNSGLKVMDELIDLLIIDKNLEAFQNLSTSLKEVINNWDKVKKNQYF